jgi:hypothetical protein
VTTMNDHDDEQLRQTVHALRRQASAALLNCDDELAADLDGQADSAILEFAARARQRQQTVEPAPGEQSSDPRGAEINRKFSESFDDVLENDEAFADAKALMEARLSDSRFASMTPDQLAQDVGERVRRIHGQQSQHTVATVPARSEVQQTRDVETLRRQSSKDYVARRIERQFGGVKR